MFKVTATIGTKSNWLYAIAHSRQDAERLQRTAIECGYPDAQVREVTAADVETPEIRGKINRYYPELATK